MNTDYAKNLITLLNDKADTKRLLKTQEAAISELSDSLLDDFINEGVSSINVQGHTLFIHNSMSASRKGSGPGAAVACSEVGLGDCITIGTQKLTALIRECEVPEGAEPGTTKEEVFFETYPQLRDIIHVEHKVALRTRKAQ